MTPEERLALALAEIQRELASLKSQIEQLKHEMQVTVDICRGCPGFGFDDGEPL